MRKALTTASALTLALGIVSGCAAAASTHATKEPVQARPTIQPILKPVVYSFGAVDGFGRWTALARSRPAAVSGIRGTVVQIAASNSNGYALTANGTLWAWGAGGLGELGTGTTPVSTRRAVAVKFPRGVRIASLGNPMPFDTGLAIDTHGNVWGWGANTDHSLCLPTTAPVLVPRKLPLSDVTLASGARSHSLFLAHGEVVACGDNAAGDLGNGTTTPSPTPTPVVGLPRGHVIDLVSSWEGSGALMADGAYYDWGFNKEGQLGDGTTTNSPVPMRVRLPAAVDQVFQGGSHASNGQTLALLINGTIWAWGDGKWGQLGNGTHLSSSLPVRVHTPRGVSFTSVATGGYTSYAVSRADVLWSWGDNRFGQLGDGGSELSRSRPRSTGLAASAVVSTDLNVVAYGISAGG